MSHESGLSIIAAFLVGSIPFGWIIAKLWGVSDLRKVGSANIGATNVVRSAGKLAGALTFLLDAAKGIVPMIYFPEVTVWVGLAAVAGHCFSPFMSFRGGKGVSTTLGVLLTYNPWLGGASILAYGLSFAITRVSAMGSLAGMLTATMGALLFSPMVSEKLAVLIMVAIVLARHRDNWNKLLAAWLALTLVSISSAPHGAVAAESKAIALKDYRGKIVNTALHPKRVVTLMPNLAELVVDLNAGDRLLAAPEYSRLPESLRTQVKNLGPYNHISTEVIYAAKPDLVLASMDGNMPAQVNRLEKLGLNVITVNTQSLADITRSMNLVAAALGVKDKSKIERFQKALLAEPARANDKPPRVFLQVGWEPLVTISKKTFVAELLQAAGGANVFADSAIKYPRPNPEEVVARDPDVIIICQLTDDGNEARKALAYWKKFERLKAVKDARIHIVSGDLVTKPGFTLLQGLEELKKIL